MPLEQPPASAGAPITVDYLVGTVDGALSNEIVVGTTPGGELGGTWDAPTVDTTHSGSSHAGVISTHEGAADPHTGYVREADANWTDLTDGGATTLHTHAGGSEAFPVGSVFIAVVSTNPGTLLGYGTWSAFGAGRVLVGFDSGQTEFDTVEETGGAKTHTLTEAEMPAHTHVITELRDATTGAATTNIALTADTSSTLGTKVTGSRGGGGAHNNLQPYIVVYMWKRTA